MTVEREHDDLRRRARRIAGRKLGFTIHAAVYLLVNVLLIAVDLRTGSVRWSVFPLLGWGIGLAAHGLVAFGPFEQLRRRLVEREVERLQRQR
jgi:hypothetical protein